MLVIRSDKIFVSSLILKSLSLLLLTVHYLLVLFRVLQVPMLYFYKRS